ncbi:NUDIX domain-containing protein [Streptomyces atroolivaceus]|uniref:NUDIX domain-containing protein n=1 Tax=Streptomyces atroolivaceus TaxID=66869 RepID=UPI0036668A21
MVVCLLRELFQATAGKLLRKDGGLTQRQGQARSDHGIQIAGRSDTSQQCRTAGPEHGGREPALLIAAREPLTRRFLPLIGQRSTNPPASPGGHVDVGETSLSAAVRDLEEEAGIRCSGP